jgi:hypothetical protein
MPDASEMPGDVFNRLAESKGWHSRCDGALCFQRSELARFADLWRGKAGAGLPRRSDFGPREMQPYMPQLAIFDAVGERFQVRLFGTALMGIYGEATGRFIDEYFSPAAAEIWMASLRETLGARVPLRYRGHVSYEKRNFFQVESVQTPLSESGGPADRVLMAMYLADGPARLI